MCNQCCRTCLIPHDRDCARYGTEAPIPLCPCHGRTGGARVGRGTVALRYLGCLPTITSSISGVKDAQRSRRQSIWAVYTSLRHTAKYTGFGCISYVYSPLASSRLACQDIQRIQHIQPIQPYSHTRHTSYSADGVRRRTTGPSFVWRLAYAFRAAFNSRAHTRRMLHTRPQRHRA